MQRPPPQDCERLFNLVSSNDLKVLRIHLNPHTLNHRRFLVGQKLGGKSLLQVAIECGFRDIVKYLLVECDAGVTMRPWGPTHKFSPLLCLIQKLDLRMLFVILNRLPYMARGRIDCVSNYALNEEYYSLLWIIHLYIKRHLSSNPQLMTPKLAAILRDFEFEYRLRSEKFIKMIHSFDAKAMKLYLAAGVNLDFRNSEGDNALSLAISENNEEAVRFLTRSVYSYYAYVLALELCGARLISFRLEKQRGFHCWRRALDLRLSMGHDFFDKTVSSMKTVLGMEFRTHQDLDQLEGGDDADIFLQTLLVFLRILSQPSNFIVCAFLHVSLQSEILSQPKILLKIFAEMHKLLPEVNSNGLLSPKERVLIGVTELFETQFPQNLPTIESFLFSFRNLLDFFDVDLWRKVSIRNPELFIFAFKRLHIHVLDHLWQMQRFPLGVDDRAWLKVMLKEILELNPYPYNSKLLHFAILQQLPLSAISFLLECSADPNCFDHSGNTPLHLVALLNGSSVYRAQLMELLIRAGAHIDSVNLADERPLEGLLQRGLLTNPLNHLSLKCLAAQVISKNEIDVDEEDLPKELFKFLQIHLC